MPAFETIAAAPEWLEGALLQAELRQIERLGTAWRLNFGEASVLTTDTLWRVLEGGRIAVTNEDDGQGFGLPEPVDASRRATALLTGRVTAVTLSPVTADLALTFEGGATLELINTSSGYEAWTLVTHIGGMTHELIALGGGALSIATSSD
jgi:hypothetical protein